MEITGDMVTGYQAIVTKYHGPSNVKGARISATASAGRVYMAWGYEDDGRNHMKAARTLADKFGWKGHLVGGALPGEAGYCFVMLYDHRAPEWRPQAEEI